MRRFLIVTCAIFSSGCTNHQDSGFSPRYGKEPNELIVGSALGPLVNASNPFLFQPWCQDSDETTLWAECQVTFTHLLTLRKEPNTFHIQLTTAKPIKEGLPTLSWISRDDCRDGDVYRKLVLRDGKYLVGYKVLEKGFVIQSLQSSR